KRSALTSCAQTLQAHSPARELGARHASLDQLQRRFLAQPPRVLDSARKNFHRLDGMLRLLGPEATLRRGYSITTDAKGKIIASVADVRSRMKIRTRLSDGAFPSQVIAE
ncbi:MAG: exodeoxyribonuclease VII large subunit, partial [Chthoniobacterales bacterium]